MFGLSFGQIVIIVVIGVLLLGPERIPVAVQWTMNSLRKVRNLAAGAQAQLRSEIGPELDELRRQVAELQGLKELQELRTLRDLNPKNIIGKTVLGDEFSGGLTGFLGLQGDPLAPLDPNAPTAPAGRAPAPGAAVPDGQTVSMDSGAEPQPAVPLTNASPSVHGSANGHADASSNGHADRSATDPAHKSAVGMASNGRAAESQGASADGMETTGPETQPPDAEPAEMVTTVGPIADYGQPRESSPVETIKTVGPIADYGQPRETTPTPPQPVTVAASGTAFDTDAT